MAQEKWINSKQATLIRLKYDDGEMLVEMYQEYLDDEVEETDIASTFEEWYEDFLDDCAFFKSREWQDEMFRLSEKD